MERQDEIMKNLMEFAEYVERDLGGDKNKVLKMLKEHDNNISYVMMHGKEAGCDDEKAEFMLNSHKIAALGETIRRVEELGVCEVSSEQ